jgi:hypothetical protein
MVIHEVRQELLDWLQRFHRASPSPRFSGYRTTTLTTTVTSSPPSIPLYPAVTLSLPLDKERPPALVLPRAASEHPRSCFFPAPRVARSSLAQKLAASRGPGWRTPTPPRWSPPRRTGGTGAPAGWSRRRPPLLPVPPNPPLGDLSSPEPPPASSDRDRQRARELVPQPDLRGPPGGRLRDRRRACVFLCLLTIVSA